MRFVIRTIVVLAVGMAIGSTLWAQCNENCPEKRTISVGGTGHVTADADLAVVRVGYKVYGPDAKTVYGTAVDTSNAIMKALTGSGIPSSAIESSSQILQHTQAYEMQQFPMNPKDQEQKRAEREFNVAQSWTIRVKPDEAAKALDTAVTAGANESGWIQWIVEDPGALQAEASAKAVANARAIAEQIAQKSNVHLGHLVSVTENQGPMAYNGTVGGGYSTFGAGVTFASAVPPMGNQQLALNSRRVEFTISVYAVFAIE
jgi:uncharacterized protein YggE